LIAVVTLLLLAPIVSEVLYGAMRVSVIIRKGETELPEKSAFRKLQEFLLNSLTVSNRE
jgi:hypothetical protein